MNVKKLFFVACHLFGVLSFAQVGINTTTPNAQLDIRATSATAPTNTDGLLIPKVDVFPATNPTAAQQGMLLYLTTTSGSNAPGFYYWDNPTTTWIGLGKDVKAWQLNGNTVNATTDFMGSTNDADVIFKRNNVRAGRIGATNTSFGVDALNPASTGSRNTATGVSSLSSNTSGTDNTATGALSLRSNTTGYQNTASGSASLLYNTTGYQNTASGTASLYSNTTGYQNTASGSASLYSNTTGYLNTASGSASLRANTTGSNNTASGVFSLFSNTTGYQNTASGTSSLYSNTTGSNNTGLGYNTQTGTNLTNASAIGANASATTSNSLVLGSINGVNGATASANVGIGTTAPNAALEVKAVNPAAPTNTEGLLIPRINVFPATNPTAAQQGMLVYLTTTVGSNTPGFYYWDNPTTSWVGIGGSASGNNWALAGNTVNATTDFMGSTNNADVIFKRNNVRAGRIGANNTSFGVYALNPASTGSLNTATGVSSLSSNTSGTSNTATGALSLRSNTTGSNNTASGASSLNFNTTGTSNTATGALSLRSNTTGSNNTASGASSLNFNTTGFNNTASGASSLYFNTTGFSNTASGTSSLYFNTTGSQNTASGAYSLRDNTTGYQNTASGNSSLLFNTTGNFNSAFGNTSLPFNTTGISNSASGAYSLYSNTTGNNNTASGTSSLYANTTGSQNTAIGYYAFFSGASFSNSTALGANTVISDSNQVRLGNNAVTSIGGQVDWTTLSDSRFKTENAAKVPGIDFIKKLRPVTYYVNHEAMNTYLNVGKENGDQNNGDKAPSSGSNAYKPTYTKTLESGFMAQEVEQAAKELGYEFNGVDAPKNDKDYYGLRYGQFVVPLVKAVQELNEKLEQKQAENDQLKAMLLELEKRIAKLEKNASN
ncbi:hypothetical protein [Flavobacterium sp.]|uniref:hypothetical protein n=1 Tax=Flavobacterium sp. TaxID=239 RepID=UPI0035AF2993